MLERFELAIKNVAGGGGLRGKMKKRRIFGIYLSLFMLIMTACRGYEDAAPKDFREYEQAVQQSSQEDETAAPATLQEHETAAPQQIQETENSQEDADSDNLPAYGEYYYDLVNVVLYLEVYDELPPNYITKKEAQALGWEGGSVEKYKEGAAIGGDTFGNREGLLPQSDGRRYTECDIDTDGYSSRGSRRLVFSNDGLYFYTADHYETFTEVTVTEEYEVIW